MEHYSSGVGLGCLIGLDRYPSFRLFASGLSVSKLEPGSCYPISYYFHKHTLDPKEFTFAFVLEGFQ